MSRMKALISSGVILSLLVVATAVPVVAEEPAGNQGPLVFRTKHLNDCVLGATKVNDWPFEKGPVQAAGVRFYSKDGFEGRHITFCLKVESSDDGFDEVSGHGSIRFLKEHRFYRDTESIKVIGELCELTLWHETKAEEVGWGLGGGRSAQRAIFHPARQKGQTMFKRGLEVVEPWDDRFWKLWWSIDCN